MNNKVYVCPLCGYANDKIININNKSYYKIITKVKSPSFLFIWFELSTDNDNIDINGNINSIGFINNIIWHRMKDNIDIIINLIVDNFVIYIILNLNWKETLVVLMK